MRLTALEPEALDRLHDASLEILRTVGVRVPHPEMLQRFREAGADVDANTAIVRIPEAVIERCLATAGKQFTIYGRDRKDGRVRRGQAQLQQHRRAGALGRTTAASAAMPRWTTSRPRPRLGDALPRITIVGAMADPHEIPVGLSLRRGGRDAAQAHHQADHLLVPRPRVGPLPATSCWPPLRAARRRPRAYPAGLSVPGADQPAAVPLQRHRPAVRDGALNLPVPIGPMAQMGAIRAGHAGGHDGAGERGDPGRRLHHAAHPPGHAGLLRRHPATPSTCGPRR